MTVLCSDYCDALFLDSDDCVSFPLTPASLKGLGATMTSDKMCCVPNCGTRQKTLHKFPNPDKDPDRFRAWIYNIGGDILSLENAIIYKYRRVCHMHFETKFHTRSNKLSPNAVPTLSLSGFLKRRRPLEDITNETALATSTATGDSISASCSSQVISNIGANTASTHQQESFDKIENNQPATTTATKKTVKKMVKCEQVLVTEVRKLKKENDSFQRRLKKAKKLSTNSAFQAALKKFTTLASVFTVMQFREICKPKMSRRFNKEEKIMALSLYKAGPKAYRWLSKIFVLPSPVTLSRIISRANLKPGMNVNIFDQLKKRVAKMSTDDRLCTLIFDEMAILPHFEYNRRRDQISGFVNYAGEATQKIADHVLVFMIRGIIRNYKQPIYYSFCSGSTPKDILVLQIKEIIKKLHDIGFEVLATICDQGTTNTSAINYLIEDTKRSYLRRNQCPKSSSFEIDGKEIIPLYDVPHLLKGVRNNLLSKNLHFTINEETKVAKWEHIIQLYENNPTYKGLKIIKNLTENHCNKEKIPKMKVKYASQLFSQTVGKTMGFLAENGILPEETKDTADLILFIDDLFDSLNGSRRNSTIRSGKDLLRNVTPKSRHSEVWLHAKKVLRSMKFVCTNSSRPSSVPSISNWLKTVESMEYLRYKLFNDYKIKSFWCRHLNQDPLENFFGSIRSHGLRNNTPSCTAFEAAFASLLINNMSSNYSPGSNCEEDFCTMFESFDELFFSKNVIGISSSSSIDYDDIFNENVIGCFDSKKKNPRILAQLEYVTGYILRKARAVFKNCNICIEYLYSKDPGINKYLKRREYFKNKKYLHYPSESVTNCFSEIQDCLHHVLRYKSHINNLKNYMKTILYINVSTNFMQCDKHKNELIEFIFEFSSRFFAINWCKMTNRLLNGTSTDVDILDNMQNQALLYCSKRRKRRIENKVL